MFDDDEIDAGPAIRPTSGWVVIQPVEVQFMGAPSTLPAGTVLIDGFHGKVLDWARPVAGFPLPHSGVVAVRAARLKGPDGATVWGVALVGGAQHHHTSGLGPEEAFEMFAAAAQRARGWP